MLPAVATLLFTNAGCIIPIPIAIFPAPCKESGRELRFQDKHGKLIQRDGLLIVSRSQSIRGLRCAPSNHVVQIRRGRARIPHEWVPASIWLGPNELLGFGIVGEPLVAVLIMLLPYPTIIPDSDNVSAIPLIPGYHEGQKRFDQPYAKSHWSPKASSLANWRSAIPAR